MDLIITGIVFIVIFSILVLIHEWGHFMAAKKSGIKVEEFGFGLPPRIWGIKKGETLFSLNWIPFGGFVRLLGEDSSDEQMIKNKRSFVSKKPRAKIFVVIAGVMMNLLLAFFLLTFGFSFGIQPLIVNGDEVLSSINKGLIEIEQGVTVEKVEEGSPAFISGMLPGDKIISVDDKPILLQSQITDLNKFSDKDVLKMEVYRNGNSRILIIQKENDQVEAGFSTFNTIYLPRVIVENVKKGSESEKAGIKRGDVILKVNDQPIYYVDEFNSVVYGTDSLTYNVFSGGETKSYYVDLPENKLVVISNVFPDSPAEKAGLLKGDMVLAINGKAIREPVDVSGSIKKGEKNLYEIKREDNVMTMNIVPNETGMIGVALAVLLPFDNYQVSVYPSEFATSVVKIKDEIYPFWIAPFKAIEEIGRLSVLTVSMFVDVVRSLVTTFIVPDGVAGPVGIAQLTHVFVQEGFLSILRFMALLSLSLAIINILPFPALDGGRLFFILVEVIAGKRINPKVESIIHAVGFMLLMVMIFAVTYNDIVRLF
jgi:regulator of sigma E protease